jgi:2-aminoadipate transaminase
LFFLYIKAIKENLQSCGTFDSTKNIKLIVMVTDLDLIFSDMVKRSKRSAIREILKLTQQPEIISFAGGLPAPESFPIDDLKEIVNQVLYNDGAAALQYDATEGLKELRETLVKKYQDEGVNCSIDNLIITTASQQGLDLLGRIFLNKGDKVICGLPSYLGGISAFMSYGAQMVGVPLDDKGMRADALKSRLKELKERNEKPKFIYIIPDFQNPAGITMPKERRQQIIGWVLADPKVLDKMVVSKQSADLCTPTFVQKIAAKYLKSPQFPKNLKQTIDLYHKRRDIMLEGFRRYMPEGVSWTEPEGGLFLFVTLPEYMNAEELFFKAVEKKVAYVIGQVFYADGSGKNTLRLNFSFVNEEQNREGVKRLAEVFSEEIARHKNSKSKETSIHA